MRFPPIMQLLVVACIGTLASTASAEELITVANSFVSTESSQNNDMQQIHKGKQTARLKNGWHHDYKSAMAEAKKSGKPVLLHFYADWCGPCQQMEQSVLNESQITQLFGTNIIAAKINVDHNSDLVSKFGISSYPSDVFVAADGTVIRQLSGFQSLDSYAATIQSVGQNTTPAEPVVSISRAVQPKDNVIGLKGYSPIALTDDQKWLPGSEKFQWNYNGVVYRMTSQAGLELFKADPEHYAPRLQGNDPTIFSGSDREAVQGDIKHAVFFDGALYLFASADNLARFMDQPGQFATSDFLVEVAAHESIGKTAQSN